MAPSMHFQNVAEIAPRNCMYDYVKIFLEMA